jgi:hypothetical protein
MMQNTKYNINFPVGKNLKNQFHLIQYPDFPLNHWLFSSHWCTFADLVVDETSPGSFFPEVDIK